MIRIEYDIKEETKVKNLVPSQVVDALILEYSSVDKTKEAQVLDIYNAVDKTASEHGELVIKLGIKMYERRRPHNITELVETMIAPANVLAMSQKNVLRKYCAKIDEMK